MFKVLTPRGVVVSFAVIIALVTAGLAWLVISYEPPAFFGYVFGALSGALWISLYILVRDYWEDNL